MLLPEGYKIRKGSRKDRSVLLNFLYVSYEEIFPEQKDFSHLEQTVRQYFNLENPLWLVETKETSVGCIWMGNAIDQVTGTRYSHIFLLYVQKEHRRQGIGKALMTKAQTWAKERGDRQIGLNVFPQNQTALKLYESLGYETCSWLMVKPLNREK